MLPVHVCLGFAALIILAYLARYFVDEWSEAIIPSFNAGFQNFFVRMALWATLYLCIFGIMKLLQWAT